MIGRRRGQVIGVVLAAVLLGAGGVGVAGGQDGDARDQEAAAPTAEERAQAREAWLAERERMRREGVEFIRHYYEHPDPDGVAEHVAGLSRSGFLRTQWNRGVVAGFLIPVVRANPDRAAGWLEAWSELPDDHLAGLMMGVWLSQIDGVEQILAAQLGALDGVWSKAVTDLFDMEPYDPLEVRDPEAWQFDLVWGWYGATGDGRCLARMLVWTQHEGDETSYAEPATLSLSYNAAVNPDVRAWCERELEKSETDAEDALPEAYLLQGILDDAEFVYENRKELGLSEFGVPH